MITDTDGLDAAYADINNVIVHNKTIFISGTHELGDIAADVTIPFRQLERTHRYAQAESLLALHPEVDTIVGHSLGAAIATRLAEQYPRRIRGGRMYGSPTIGQHPNFVYYRHHGDPVSVSNRLGQSASSSFFLGNPHSYRGFPEHYN